MGYARCHLVDPTTPGTFHCVSRCVRRAFLCGVDEVTNQNYEHRRGLLEERIHLLAGQFAVALHAYAVMSNHLHLVIAIDPLGPTNWTDAEVVERWRRVFPVRAKSETQGDDADPNALTPDQRVEPERIATWRQRLGSLSWFMRALLEHVARKANQEDGCTGRFWEERFFSQALLDERAILAASAYVDLNPVRAEMAHSLAGSAHTGVARRLAALQSALPASPPEPLMLPPVAGSCRIADCLPIKPAQYLELLAWSGNVPVFAGETGEPRSGAAIGTACMLRKVLDCDPSERLAEFTAIRQRWRLVGGNQKVREWLDLRSRRWMRKSKRKMQRCQRQSKIAHLWQPKIAHMDCR